MWFNDGWLLIWWSFLFGLTQLLDQSHWFAFQAAGESPASSAMHQLDQLITANKILIEKNVSEITFWHFHCNPISNYLLGHIQKLIQIDATIGELPKCTFLLQSIINLKFKWKPRNWMVDRNVSCKQIIDLNWMDRGVSMILIKIFDSRRAERFKVVVGPF